MQINPDVPTIERCLKDALVLSGGISKDNEDKLSALKWSRSARTDKGVSAIGQVVALRLMHPPGLHERLQRSLPKQIKVFGFRCEPVAAPDTLVDAAIYNIAARCIVEISTMRRSTFALRLTAREALPRGHVCVHVQQGPLLAVPNASMVPLLANLADLRLFVAMQESHQRVRCTLAMRVPLVRIFIPRVGFRSRRLPSTTWLETVRTPCRRGGAAR